MRNFVCGAVFALVSMAVASAIEMDRGVITAGNGASISLDIPTPLVMAAAGISPTMNMMPIRVDSDGYVICAGTRR